MARFVLRPFLLVLAISAAAPARAITFTFSTGGPDNRMAMASRPHAGAKIEIEAADDFVVSTQTTLTSATFIGLISTGTVSNISAVDVEIYRVFPQDSDTVRTIQVPTRANSPSDVAFAIRDITNSTFAATLIAPSFTALNSVLNGINKIPNQQTLGEGPVTGGEISVTVTFTTPLVLPAGHYFFIPQVTLSAGDFYWLSAPKPIVTGTPFAPDLQAWIRNEGLAPDWLRVGTDIVGGAAPPTFNGTFSLAGTALAALTVTGVPLTVPEGTAFSGTVANFTDTDVSQPAANFTATVDWGDGTTSAGTITGSAGTFAVSGNHTYADEGSFAVQVTVNDIANASTGSSTSTATVSERDVLTGTGLAIAAIQGNPFNGAVANFSDTFAGNVASDFTATINWGDGATTAGTISGSGASFTVSGSHTYSNVGSFTLTVTMSDDAPGTATATALGTAAVTAPAPAAAVPTLEPTGLAAFALSLALVAVWLFRRR
jgi:hypothetical protein